MSEENEELVLVEVELLRQMVIGRVGNIDRHIGRVGDIVKLPFDDGLYLAHKQRVKPHGDAAHELLKDFLK